MNKRFFQLFSVLTLFALLFTLLSYAPVKAAEAVEDQSCDNANIASADGYWLIKAHTSLAQTFKPTKNHMSSITLALAGGSDVNAAVTAQITQEGGGVVTTKTATTQSAQVSWVDFTFPTVTVDTTKTYRVTLTTPSNTARWIVSTVECYANGKAYVNGVAQSTQDFGFVTYGFQVNPVTATPTATTLVLAKPTSLVGTYSEAAGMIRLTWAKSTSSVDGYEVYRSKSASSGFSRIAKVSATTLEYIDPTDIAPGNFYYYVKAYKGSTTSPGSNTVTVTVTAPTMLIATPSVVETLIATPTPVVTSASILTIMMTTYFTQMLMAFALLLCGVIALVVLLAKPKVTPAVKDVSTVSSTVVETTTVGEMPVDSSEEPVAPQTTKKK